MTPPSIKALITGWKYQLSSPILTWEKKDMSKENNQGIWGDRRRYRKDRWRRRYRIKSKYMYRMKNYMHIFLYVLSLPSDSYCELSNMEGLEKEIISESTEGFTVRQREKRQSSTISYRVARTYAPSRIHFFHHFSFSSIHDNIPSVWIYPSLFLSSLYSQTQLSHVDWILRRMSFPTLSSSRFFIRHPLMFLSSQRLPLTQPQVTVQSVIMLRIHSPLPFCFPGP